MHRACLILVLACSTTCLASGDLPFDANALLKFGLSQLVHATLPHINYNTTLYPSYTALGSNKRYEWVPSSAGGWTSGHFPGQLWQLFNHTGDAQLRTYAQQWTAGIRSQEYNTGTHDVGFMLYYSFGLEYRLTHSPDALSVLHTGAASLSTRFSPIVGCIRSWNGPGFEVIIDNMMNLELLFFAAANGGNQTWHEMAVSHATKTAKNHIRPAGNSWHMVVYDPQTGAVLEQTNTPQGMNCSTCTWARGQAWAVYGFTMTYRYTRDPAFLTVAQNVSDWMIEHLPSDFVPVWDYGAPPTDPRDTSAASIAASGLFELSSYVPEPAASRYRNTAYSIVASLAKNYLGNPALTDGILINGTSTYPMSNISLDYGDYYFLEVLMRALYQ